MIKVNQLKLGFSDAENYRRRENKNLLNELFIKDTNLDKLCEPSVSFLIGDKGTGKTAYSVFMSNSTYNNNFSSLKYIRETEYKKFLTIKKEKSLDLSDYTSIWKVILYLLLSEQVYEQEKTNPLFDRFRKIHALHEAIQEFYVHAFSPEIQYALSFVQESKLAAELFSKHLKLEGELSKNSTFSETRFQTNLLYIQKNFEHTFTSLKLQKNHILFIDGIDVRAAEINYPDYLECIKGLANAIWSMNNDFFPSIKDSKGRLKVVLLIRPDIFNSLRLQNQNTKIKDNSVLLSWDTTYRDHRSSNLFSLANKLLAHGQPEKSQLEDGQAWDYYFPFNTPNVREFFPTYSSFISFLRFAYYRPRDIITQISMLQERHRERYPNSKYAFDLNDFEDSTFKRNYAEYLLGEVKDQISFYYSDDEYSTFLDFFTHLDGQNKFSYETYQAAFRKHIEVLNEKNIKPPNFMSKPSDFLQFLYELNIICYIERTENDKPFIHWCFKDRSYSNISPKVKLHQTYEIFYGMAKALNTGRRIISNNHR